MSTATGRRTDHRVLVNATPATRNPANWPGFQPIYSTRVVNPLGGLIDRL
jgi:hypothetical protein